MIAQLSMHIAAHGTNNDGEWMAVHRAARYAVEHKLANVDIITDSACVTAQINNNASVNHPKHAAVHDATASLLAQVPRWRVRHVHRECNELADAKATEGQTRDTADEYTPMPSAVQASTRARATSHLSHTSSDPTNIHARLSTWTIPQLTSTNVQEWEVEAATKWLKSNTAPGEDGITPEMITCAGKPMTRVLTAMFNKCWAAGKVPTRWGIAHVRMLHKRDSKNKCTNYRGISLLSVISKMYEKINANRPQALQRQIPECRGMQSEQMGFNPNHRVEDAVHGIVEGIKYNRNHGNKKVVLLSAT